MNSDYDLVIKRFHLCYNIRLGTFGIERDKNLIIKFPVFIQPYTQQLLVLYRIPVPITDQNKLANSYTHLQIDRPYTAINTDMYITIRQQELRTCMRIGFEFYCKEFFMVKHESKYSYESAIYFDLDPDIIKENCTFTFYCIRYHSNSTQWGK